MSGAGLALLALVVVGASGALWMIRLSQVRTGEVRVFVIAGMALGAVLAVTAFAEEPGLAGGAVAAVALVIAGVFLALQPLSAQARVTPAVQVGGPILDFSAPDDRGESFELATLRGRPFLLKFFRGHW